MSWIGLKPPTRLPFILPSKDHVKINRGIQHCDRQRGSNHVAGETFIISQGGTFLGGGFKCFFVFIPSPGEMMQFDYSNIFQWGWFNHQLVLFQWMQSRPVNKAVLGDCLGTSEFFPMDTRTNNEGPSVKPTSWVLKKWPGPKKERQIFKLQGV